MLICLTLGSCIETEWDDIPTLSRNVLTVRYPFLTVHSSPHSANLNYQEQL
jgi:hypothetical protein